MSPTLLDGDYLLIRRTHDVRPGELVVVDRSPVSAKRVVAVGNATVDISGGIVQVDRTTIDDVWPGTTRPDGSWVVGEQSMFLLGDNRAESTDSREYGAIPTNLIIGRVIVRYWPLRRFSLNRK
jgi:signal peptidase I